MPTWREVTLLLKGAIMSHRRSRNTLGQSDVSIDLTSKFMTYRSNQHFQVYIHNLVKNKRQVEALFFVVRLLFGFVCMVFAFICMFHYYSCRRNIKIGSHCLKMSKFLFCLHCQNSFFFYTLIFLKSCKWHLESCLFISWKKKSRKYLVYNMLQKLKTRCIESLVMVILHHQYQLTVCPL